MEDAYVMIRRSPYNGFRKPCVSGHDGYFTQRHPVVPNNYESLWPCLMPVGK